MTSSSAMKSHRGIISTPEGATTKKDPSTADIGEENGGWDPRERTAMGKTPRSTMMADDTSRLSRSEARGLTQQADVCEADGHMNHKDVGVGGHEGGETDEPRSLPSLASAAVLSLAAEGAGENGIHNMTRQESLPQQSESTPEEKVEEDPPEREGMLLGLAEIFAAEVRQVADAEEYEVGIDNAGGAYGVTIIWCYVLGDRDGTTSK